MKPASSTIHIVDQGSICKRRVIEDNLSRLSFVFRSDLRDHFLRSLRQ